MAAGSTCGPVLNTRGTKDGDWRHLTLDVYPDEEADATAEIYEDDTQTVAYKNGQFRTAAVSLKGEGKTETLTVSKAIGGFTGNLAFTGRTYTVRVHAPRQGRLQQVLINDKPASFSVIHKDPSAAPFAVGGGAADGTVCEFSFSANVYEKSEIKLIFE